MTQLSGKRLLTPGADRLHAPLATMCVVAAGFIRSFITVLGKQYPQIQAATAFSFFGAVCNQFPVVVKLPMNGPLEDAVAIRPIGAFEIEFEHTGGTPHGSGNDQYFAPFINTVLGPVFVTFYEAYSDWLVQQPGMNNHYSWSPALRFARIIRNAIVHGGEISIGNANAPAVTWHSLTYGPADNGKKPIGTDLTTGDLLVLLTEASDELDALGAPILY